MVGNILPNQLYRVFKSRPLTTEGEGCADSSLSANHRK